MEITNTPTEFTSDDSIALRTFLRTTAGERLIPKLAESLPALLAGGGLHEILIRSGEVRGAQEVIKNIIALAYPAPEFKSPITNTNYPDLTNDAAWEDGVKIQTP